MKKMAAGKFKAQCLRIMEQVRSTREPVLITKRGQPLAKLVPAESQPADIFGCLKDEIKIVGDIESPIADWDYWKP